MENDIFSKELERMTAALFAGAVANNCSGMEAPKILTVKEIETLLAKIENATLESLPNAIVEAWGRERCLKLISCEVHQHPWAPEMQILCGGNCEIGEMFLITKEAIVYFPPMKFPEFKPPKITRHLMWPYSTVIMEGI